MAPADGPDVDDVIEGLVGRPWWHQYAACWGADPGPFFSEKDKSAKGGVGALCRLSGEAAVG